MGRELKRVPLDFDWPLDKVWYGYYINMCMEDCEACKHFAKIIGLELNEYDCPKFPTYDPPIGKGYQLWETTSEGSPVSPVFKTVEALAKWCEDGATILGSEKMSYDKWLTRFRNELRDMENEI